MSERKPLAQIPTIPSNMGKDLHNLEVAGSADLVLFVAGNQFMVMPELIAVFQKEHPDARRIFYETLPPGLEVKQILAGGARFGDSVISVMPDVYASVSRAAMEALVRASLVKKNAFFLYLHNRIVLMVPGGNPAGIRRIEDLARDEVRISQPDPANEDIAVYIIDMYRQAGGDSLAKKIMENKRAEGTTIMTIVHHRETPLRLTKKTVDVGPVWATEYINARAEGLDFECIDPGSPLDQRDSINYYITPLNECAHPKNAAKFLDFIKSKTAQEIYKKYGFIPHFS